jgi:hypothetical protein
MSRTASFLRAQLERAKRFAAAMTNPSDRERFESAADKYRRELNALSESSEATGSQSPESADASRPSDAVAARSESDTAAPPDAVAATDDSAPTTPNDTGQQETD